MRGQRPRWWPETAAVIIIMKMRRTALAVLAIVLAYPALGGAQSPGAVAPDTAPYFFLLGRYYESKGEIDKAIASHKTALDLDPASAEVRAELAGLYARQDRPAEAVDMAEAALKQDPANREANRIIGSVFATLAEQRKPLKPGDDPALYVPRAIAALERARQDGDIGLELTLGRLYLQTKAYDKAVPLLRRVVQQQPGYTEMAVLLATAQDGAGQTADAVETLRAALDENPKSLRAWVMLGEMSEKDNQWRSAADAFARAQALSTGIDLGTRRAAALINAGDGPAARDLLKGRAAAAKVEPIVLYLYATALRQTGDLAGAEETARRLRAAAPDDPRGMYALAQILEARKDFAGAEGSLREILKRDPTDATALNYLGYMLAERGQRLDEAVDLVQRALKLEPGNPSFLDSLGWAYYQQGKLDLADPPLSEAATKMPKNSVIQDHLGDLRFKQQRFADAAAAWERSLNGDGDSIDRPRIEKKIQDVRSRLEPRH
jgi:tetratricopeptide (TPR) repeat protein